MSTGGFSNGMGNGTFTFSVGVSYADGLGNGPCGNAVPDPEDMLLSTRDLDHFGGGFGDAPGYASRAEGDGYGDGDIDLDEQFIAETGHRWFSSAIVMLCWLYGRCA